MLGNSWTGKTKRLVLEPGATYATCISPYHANNPQASPNTVRKCATLCQAPMAVNCLHRKGRVSARINLGPLRRKGAAASAGAGAGAALTLMNRLIVFQQLHVNYRSAGLANRDAGQLAPILSLSSAGQLRTDYCRPPMSLITIVWDPADTSTARGRSRRRRCRWQIIRALLAKAQVALQH